MSDHIPIIDQIRDAPDHAARMRLLLACPRLHLVRCEAILRQTLNVAGFLSAAVYVPVSNRHLSVYKRQHDEGCAIIYRSQAAALDIEAEAKRRLAYEYDAAQARGEVRRANN